MWLGSGDTLGCSQSCFYNLLPRGSHQELKVVREMGIALSKQKCCYHVSFSHSILGHNAL